MATPNYGSTGSSRSKADPAADSYDAIKGDIASLTESVKKLASDQMGPAMTNAQDQVKQKIGDIESSIRKNPTQAALVAAGLGFVVGLVLSR
jgi:ElaB/YqjD/DUF883 family membrane-anchored ribosome-binding protein